MRLFVVGNISSGKSFLIEKIKKVLPEYEVLKIDDYRTNHCDGSLEAELKMWKDFPREIIKYCNVIVELSGGGEVTKNINELLKENSFLTIYVDTDVETCLERSKNKDFSKIPYPKEFSESIEEIIERLGKDFDKCIEEEWKKSINIIKVNSDIDVSSLPLRQYHELLKLSDTLKEIRGSLFSFGSTGRGEMSKSSDVDTFFLTKIPLEDLYGILSYNFDCVNIMGKEFVIRENGILLEVNCIEDINDARLFYNRSLITNPRKTILKDGYNIMNDLIKYSNEHINLDDEVDYIIERLDYYVESLPRIIEKKDDYKYYFHNNIVIHEYIKLKAILKGNTDFLYLPRNARNLLTKDEWDKLFYFFGDNQQKHYDNVRMMCNEIIKKVMIEYV